MGPHKTSQSALVTVKNLQCTDCLLEIIDHHGNVLGGAWFLVLTAVQHINEVFGVSPSSSFISTSSSSSSQSQPQTAETSTLALVSVEKRVEVSAIVERLTKLFKSTDKLSDDNLINLITALCKLSTDGMCTLPGKESSLFPMTSLLETGASNLHRRELVWNPITAHFTEVCLCSDPHLRGYAAEAMSSLIRAALSKTSKPEDYTQILSPLSNLTAVQHIDVRQKQLDCVSSVLHSSGQSLQTSWTVVLKVIRAAAALQSEALVRTGFQSLQLVITDFLLHLPPSSLPITVGVATQYGLQTVDINISLTCIGLLWNIADYLFQHRTELQDGLEALRTTATENGSKTSSKTGQSSETSFEKDLTSSNLPVFDLLWMLMFRGLSDLCVDQRAAVRKSSAQTLFSTISAHGTLLHRETWNEVLWQVLFPLLEQVHHGVGHASTSSLQTSSLLIHHSRDSARKQWAETQVITLQGTARLFQSRWATISALPKFPQTWVNLLAAIQRCAISTSSEVSVASTSSFLSIVSMNPASSEQQETINNAPKQQQKQQDEMETRPQLPSLSPAVQREVWGQAWQTWVAMGERCVCARLPSDRSLKSMLAAPQKTEQVDQYFAGVPSQKFLVNLLKIFPVIHAELREGFGAEQFGSLVQVLHVALPMPVAKDVSPFLVPSANETRMSALHELTLTCMGTVYGKSNVFDEILDPEDLHRTLLTRKPHIVEAERVLPVATDHPGASLYPLVIEELLKFSLLASEPPDTVKATRGVPPSSLPMMNINYVPFGLAAQSLAMQLYRSCMERGMGMSMAVVERFLKALLPPLQLKYHSSVSTVWMQSLSTLLLLLHTSLPSLLKEGPKANITIWQQLASLLEEFLFTPIPEGSEIRGEKLREYEMLDIKVIELIKRDLLPSSQSAPPHFLQRLTALFNKGSIHSATDGHSRGPFRENFARACFEALLQFSFIHSQDSIDASTSRLALRALLERCEGVLGRFVADEALSGACPLPRARMNEVVLVLKSVTVLISSLKEAKKSSVTKIDPGVWRQVALLYPSLVECVTCSSAEVRTALKEALGQFSDLIVIESSP